MKSWSKKNEIFAVLCKKFKILWFFTIFDWYRFKNSNIHKDFVCFSFPCPLQAKMVSGFCKAKSKRKWTNRQMCGINSHLLLFWKFVQRKENFIFFEQFFLIFSKNNIFWNLKYFLWKCVSYLSKTICNSSCLTAMKLFQTQIKKSLFLNNQIGVKFAVSSQFAVLY